MKEQTNSVKNNYRVIYDMQTNEYRRIHKDLGTETKVYKDGSLLKKFHPDQTGFFHPNRISQHLTRPEPSISLAASPTSSKMTTPRNMAEPKNTNLLSNFSQSKPIKRAQEKKLEQAITLPVVTQKDFFKKLIKSRQKSLQPNHFLQQDKLAQTLRKFNQIKSDTIYQNHSLHKDIPGSNPRVFPERMRLTNKMYFQTLDAKTPIIQYNIVPKTRKQLVKSVKNLQPLGREQYKRQKLLYSRANPGSTVVQKAPDFMRRDNLMRLERDFIQITERTTNRIYNHDD